jgi:outer membrane protein assembly factor BamA
LLTFLAAEVLSQTSNTSALPVSIACRYPTNDSASAIIKKLSAGIHKDSSAQLIRLFDSLGFTRASYDSIQKVYISGYRAIITGDTIITDDSIYTKLTSRTSYPRPFDRTVIDSKATRLNRVYAENGYPFATITTELKFLKASPDRDSLLVLFRINKNILTRNTLPHFRTLKGTKAALLLRYIDIQDNEPFDIRQVENSITTLKMNNFIENATYLPPLLLKDTLTSDSAAIATVPFDIIDKAGLGFEGAVGFESDQDNKPSLKGSASLSLLNMFHGAEALAFTYSGSDIKQLFDIILSKPFIFSLPLGIKANGGMEIVKDDYGFVYGNARAIITFNTFWTAGVGVEYNETTKENGTQEAGNSSYLGATFLLLRNSQDFTKGLLLHRIQFEFGSGIAKKEINYTRSRILFNASVQIPFLTSQALISRLITSHIITRETALLPVELIRYGGSTNLRGYSENLFAFRTAAIGQFELHHYFSTTGTVFILVDGGIGFTGDIAYDSHAWTSLLGYGAGIRIPSKAGIVSLSWARNKDDTKSIGRIHLQFQNDLSRLTEKFR